MDVVEAERRLRGVAERGVGLVRIILAEGVAVEKDVALLIFRQLQNACETLDEPVIARALGRKNAHRIWVEKPGALKVERAAGEGALDRRQPFRPREDGRDEGMVEIGIDQIIEVGLAGRLSKRVLVRADVDG